MMYQSRDPRIIYGKGMNKTQARPSISSLLLQLLITIGAIVALCYGLIYAVQLTSPKEVVVPQVEGLDQSAAEILLKNAGLQIELSGQRPSDKVAAGKILQQSPDAGLRVKEGRKVALVLSAGPNWTMVPDITKMSQKRAEELLGEKTLRLGQRRYVYYTKLANGFVIGQIPAPGAQVAKNSEVQAVISRGPRPGTEGPTMPDSSDQPMPVVPVPQPEDGDQ